MPTAGDRLSAAGGPLARPRKAAFKLRIAAPASLPRTVDGIRTQRLRVFLWCDSQSLLSQPMRRTIRVTRDGCWSGSEYEIGVTNRIRTGTNAFTGRDAAVTS
jgi:hypothetical protein